MGLIEKIFGKKNQPTNLNYFELLNDEGEGFFTLGDKLFKSDVIRACIRPKAKAIGKLSVKHIRESRMECIVNPDPWVRNVLMEPNEFMTGQMLLEKLITQLDLNNNAFAFIKRNEYGYPTQIYPIPCTRIEVLENKQGEIFLKFTFRTGREITLPYDSIIHLRQDFNDNEIFGDSPYEALFPLLDVIDTVDESVVQKVNGNQFIKWLLNFKEVLDQEEMQKNAIEFVDNYMKITGAGVKVGITEPIYDLEQVKSDSYVPEAQRSIDAIRRIYSFYNTNEKIIQGTYNENEWNTYYESVIDPLAIQLSNEFTRKLFSSNERSSGNRIIFETSNLKFASLPTKLALSAMVDRGSLTPNEWRTIMSMGPIKRGETPIRKLDTQPIDEKERDREREMEKQRKDFEWEMEKQRILWEWEREKERIKKCEEEMEKCEEEMKKEIEEAKERAKEKLKEMQAKEKEKKTENTKKTDKKEK